MLLFVFACADDEPVSLSEPASTTPPADSTAPPPTAPAPAPTTPQTTDSAPVPATAPSVTLTLDPAEVDAGDVLHVHVEVENFEFVDPTTFPAPPPIEGQGHFHLVLDGVLINGYWANDVELPIAASTSAGTHEVEVSLQDNHHHDVEPPVIDAATFDVR